MAKIHVKGQVLRDAENSSKRNYVNLAIHVTKDDGAHIMSYHLINYAANAASLKHILKIVSNADREHIARMCKEHGESKLSRSREVYLDVDKTFNSDEIGAFVDFISSTELKVEIKKAKGFGAGIKSRIETVSRLAPPSSVYDDDDELEEEEDFMEPSYDEPTKIKESDLIDKEKSSDLGKDTSAMNTRWGMF